MNTSIIYTLIALGVFTGLIILLSIFGKKLNSNNGFAIVVIIALIFGSLFGFALKGVFGAESEIIQSVTDWIGIISTIFIRALQLLIVPLILISIIKAISQTEGGKETGKKAFRIISVLLFTVIISGIVGYLAVLLFNLDAAALSGTYKPSDRIPTTFVDTLKSIVPNNIFSALSANSALPVVFLAILLGVAYLGVKKESADIAAKFKSAIDVAHTFIIKIVDFVISLTPYGVLAIIALRVVNSDLQIISQLGIFVIAAFAAIILMYIIHLIIMLLLGVNLKKYFKASAPTLLFAFSSRSSAATLPLTVKTLKNLGVSEANSNLAGSFGTVIGQNGCAGIHPAMVATLVALASGINVLSLTFLIPLLIYIAIGSIGIAGVGGGATQASLFILALLGLDLSLVVILASVEFFIDMGRTMLNVNDSILSGLVAEKWENFKNKRKNKASLKNPEITS